MGTEEQGVAAARHGFKNGVRSRVRAAGCMLAGIAICAGVSCHKPGRPEQEASERVKGASKESDGGAMNDMILAKTPHYQLTAELRTWLTT